MSSQDPEPESLSGSDIITHPGTSRHGVKSIVCIRCLPLGHVIATQRCTGSQLGELGGRDWISELPVVSTEVRLLSCQFSNTVTGNSSLLELTAHPSLLTISCALSFTCMVSTPLHCSASLVQILMVVFALCAGLSNPQQDGDYYDTNNIQLGS